MEELLKSLIFIQQNLNAPKDQYNSFGKYKYRSLEGIQAAIKPLLQETSCGIRFMDEVVEHCGRTFLKTTLIFFNDKGESITTTAEAEHTETKSGMDAAQITGAASSYARKYAMNSMFLIDDTLDADTEQYHTEQHQQKRPYNRKATIPSKEPATGNRQYEQIKSELNKASDMTVLMGVYKKYKTFVETDSTVKNLFTQARIRLTNAA